MNKTLLIGRLAKAPELVANGKVVKITVATDRLVGGDKKSDFLDVKFFGKTAEYVCKYAEKGTRVFVEAGLQNNHYTDKNGNEHYFNELLGQHIEILFEKKYKQEIPESEKNDVFIADAPSVITPEQQKIKEFEAEIGELEKKEAEKESEIEDLDDLLDD